MYAVTPAVESAWRELLRQVAAEAGVALDYLPYPAPQPLERLWARADLGAVFMCGYPVALELAPVVPLAAPIPERPVGGRSARCTAPISSCARMPLTERWRTPSAVAPAGR